MDVKQGKSAQAKLRNDRHLACSECVHNKINPAWPPQESRLLFTRRSSKHGCLITHKQALGSIGLVRQNKEFLVLLFFFFFFPGEKNSIHSKDHFRYILNWVKSERAPLYNVTKQPSMLTEQLHTQLFLQPFVSQVYSRGEQRFLSHLSTWTWGTAVPPKILHWGEEFCEKQGIFQLFLLCEGAVAVQCGGSHQPLPG